MFGVSYSTIDILPLLSVFNHHHSGLHYHFIIFNHQSSSSPGLPLTVCARETASQSWQEAHALVAVSHHFLFFNSILYFLHFHYALVAVTHHHGHHVHHIIKVATKKTFVTWQNSNKASAVFSGVSLTGAATFSAFDL